MERGYLDGAAGRGSTMRHNHEAFDRRRLMPRVERDIRDTDYSLTLFSDTSNPMFFKWPVAMAPIGNQALFNRKGELASASAAAKLRIPFVVSNFSSYVMEDIAQAMDDAAVEPPARLFQIYPSGSEEVTQSLVERALQSGYTGIVVTLDTKDFGWRPRDHDSGFSEKLSRMVVASYMHDPVALRLFEANPELKDKFFTHVFPDPSHSWRDLEKIVKWANGTPVFAKGIIRPEDAIAAAEHGVSAVIVSNHGGRQMDGGIAALDALPRVAEALGPEIPVLFDSGIRGGADIAKALALGARVALLGRPYIYGLTIAGETGVHHVLKDVLRDFERTMRACGVVCLDEAGADMLEP